MLTPTVLPKRYVLLSRVATFTFLTVLTIACGGDSSVPNAAGVGAYDEVTLSETDSSFVGAIGGFVALENGGYLIADRQSGMLRLYDAAGRATSTIGRRGEGPGEWSMGPSGGVRLGEGVVLVTDGMFWRAIDVTSGSVLWSRQRPTGMSGALTSANGIVYASGYDRVKRATVLSFRASADSMEIGGPFPELMTSNDLVGMYFSSIAAGALSRDTLAVAVQSSNYLFIGPFPSGPFDSLPIPVVNRRGAMPELLAQVVPSRPDIGEKALYQPSYPVAVHRLNDAGHIAIVHSDNAMTEGRMTGTLHLSIIDPRRRRACSDISLDVPADPLPLVSFRGDVLAVATQYDDSTMTSRTAIRTFDLGDAECEWRALAR